MKKNKDYGSESKTIVSITLGKYLIKFDRITKVFTSRDDLIEAYKREIKETRKLKKIESLISID